MTLVSVLGLLLADRPDPMTPELQCTDTAYRKVYTSNQAFAKRLNNRNNNRAISENVVLQSFFCLNYSSPIQRRCWSCGSKGEG